MSVLLESLIDPDVDAAFDAIPTELTDTGFDPWGFEPKSARVLFSIARQIARYFRPEIHGLENIPAGRGLVVPNHSGQLPFDGLVIAVSILVGSSPPRVVRAMAERWVPTLPFVNVAFSRCGVVVGDPINCRNLLEEENLILVFPEGVRGSGKIFQKRYQLANFGRGFMRLALQAKAPIIPTAVVGAEESIISVANLSGLAKFLGIPYVPVPALLPVLGPLSMLPLPTKFHVYFGEPMHFDGPFDDEDEAIEAKVQQVRTRVAELIDQGRRERTSWF